METLQAFFKSTGPTNITIGVDEGGTPFIYQGTLQSPQNALLTLFHNSVR